MKQRSTKQPGRLSFAATLVLCGVIITLYQLFRTEELDRSIEKALHK